MEKCGHTKSENLDSGRFASGTNFVLGNDLLQRCKAFLINNCISLLKITVFYFDEELEFSLIFVTC